MKKIYLLLGDNAVSEFHENGVKGCIKNGYNVIETIEYNGQTKMTEVVQKVLNAVSGSLDACIISKENFDAIENAFKPKKKKK